MSEHSPHLHEFALVHFQPANDTYHAVYGDPTQAEHAHVQPVACWVMEECRGCDEKRLTAYVLQPFSVSLVRADQLRGDFACILPPTYDGEVRSNVARLWREVSTNNPTRGSNPILLRETTLKAIQDLHAERGKDQP